MLDRIPNNMGLVFLGLMVISDRFNKQIRSRISEGLTLFAGAELIIRNLIIIIIRMIK